MQLPVVSVNADSGKTGLLNCRKKIDITNMLAAPVFFLLIAASTRNLMHMHRSLPLRSSGCNFLSLVLLHGRIVLNLACEVLRSSK